MVRGFKETFWSLQWWQLDSERLDLIPLASIEFVRMVECLVAAPCLERRKNNVFPSRPTLQGKSKESSMNLFPKEPDRSKFLKRETSNHSFAHYTVSMRSGFLRIGPFRTRSIVLQKAPWVRGLVCLAVVTSIPFAAGIPQSQIGNGLPYPPPSPGLPPMNRTANPTADANRLMEDSMKLQDNLKLFEKINLQRQKDMTSDTAKLIELAHELKTETDKGTPGALSILEVRRAELIEKLAHSIQAKMRTSVSVPN
jgi:hypothetical protein